eukprot:1799700-Rhodomonas_salina.2
MMTTRCQCCLRGEESVPSLWREASGHVAEASLSEAPGRCPQTSWSSDSQSSQTRVTIAMTDHVQHSSRHLPQAPSH